MTDIEKLLATKIDAVKERVMNNTILSKEEEEKDSEEAEKIISDFVFENPIVKFHNVNIDYKYLLMKVNSRVIFTVESNEGVILFVHGEKDGRVNLNNGAKVSYRDEAFIKQAEIEVGNKRVKKVHVISCYPGAKESSWEVNGVRYINYGNELRPLQAAVKDGTLAISYTSKRQQKFAEEELPMLIMMSMKTSITDPEMLAECQKWEEEHCNK